MDCNKLCLFRFYKCN